MPTAVLSSNPPENNILAQRTSNQETANLANDRLTGSNDTTDRSSSSSTTATSEEDQHDADANTDANEILRLDMNSDPYYSYGAMYRSSNANSPSNTVIWIMYFFLLRLWLEALMERDAGLMFFCLMVTALTARAAQRRREVEENITQRRTERGDVLPIGLQHLSFRAQLAHAIMESQRMQHLQQHDTSNEPANGVSEEMRRTWKRWTYHQQDQERSAAHNPMNMNILRRKGGRSGYDTIPQKLEQDCEDDRNEECPRQDDDMDIESSGGIALGSSATRTRTCEEVCDGHGHGNLLVKDVTCSICLCEYEQGDEVTMLPCKHVYHEACVKEWTGQSQRCPLCNYDLMQSSQSHQDCSLDNGNDDDL